MYLCILAPCPVCAQQLCIWILSERTLCFSAMERADMRPLWPSRDRLGSLGHKCGVISFGRAKTNLVAHINRSGPIDGTGMMAFICGYI